jgi:uncharacterized protein (DUF1810 family)
LSEFFANFYRLAKGGGSSREKPTFLFTRFSSHLQFLALASRRYRYNQEGSMKKLSDTVVHGDPFDLGRFTSAQEEIYGRVLAELRRGQKETHWMWFIFPQIDGLAYSTTSKHYAIKSLEEARQYLSHPVLGRRLLECAETVLAIEGRSISEIFGYPDDLKLKSSMTLFAYGADPGSVFVHILDKYFQGERDVRTLDLLEKLQEKMGKEKN